MKEDLFSKNQPNIEEKTECQQETPQEKGKMAEGVLTTQQKFEVYFSTLVEWNEKINLTAITNREEVFVKHFEDSLVTKNLIKQNASLCDVGTGAGFPGFPLKIVRDDLDLYLFDALNKRVKFLQEVAKRLGIKATCVHTRAEDAGKGKYREVFDVVTARAVARLNSLLEYCLPLVKVGGVFLAYKTPQSSEITESKNAIKLLGGKLQDKLETKLSNGDQRVVYVIEKVLPTPKMYPRGMGKERQRPL